MNPYYIPSFIYSPEHLSLYIVSNSNHERVKTIIIHLPSPAHQHHSQRPRGAQRVWRRQAILPLRPQRPRCQRQTPLHAGPIAIQRRYSDFDSIRGLLVKRWPGCYIPSLPSKVKLSQSDEQFLDTRSKYLQKFLLEVSKKPFLWESDEMQIFLRNDMMDLDKVLAALWKVDPAEVLYRYNKHFGEVPAEGAMEIRIQNFSQYLKTLYVKVQQLRNRSEQINSAQSKYQKKYSKFLLNVMASYQDKFLKYYNRDNPAFQPIFSLPENNQKKTDLEQSLKEAPLRVLFEELKREKREIFAMQQAIQQYDEYVAQRGRIQAKIKEHEVKIVQVRAGHKSFLSKIRSLSTDDEVKNHEKALEKYKAQHQIYIDLCTVMTRLLLVTQIESFKQERTTSYYRMVQQVAREELKIIEKERDYWLAICNNSNLNFEIEENQYHHSHIENSNVSAYHKQSKEKSIEKEAVIQHEQIKVDKESKEKEVKSDETGESKTKAKDGEEVTQKTKSVSESPKRQNSNDSPREQIIVQDDLKQAQKGEQQQIKNSNIQIEVFQSPHSDSQKIQNDASPQKPSPPREKKQKQRKDEEEQGYISDE